MESMSFGFFLTVVFMISFWGFPIPSLPQSFLQSQFQLTLAKETSSYCVPLIKEGQWQILRQIQALMQLGSMR